MGALIEDSYDLWKFRDPYDHKSGAMCTKTALIFVRIIVPLVRNNFLLKSPILIISL